MNVATMVYIADKGVKFGVIKSPEDYIKFLNNEYTEEEYLKILYAIMEKDNAE